GDRLMDGSTKTRSSAFTTVDFDKPGKQVGFVMIPHSPHDDAWGVTRVPIAIISDGKGPTVIIEGGNHGDEYEGPITICELIRELDPGQPQGRLILMPAINVHAVIAGQRTSPVDGLNFNRAFPGDPRGSITQQISDFMTHEIFSRGDAFLDLHSGGSSLDLLPSAIIEPTDDHALFERNVAAVRAFAAPMIVVVSKLGIHALQPRLPAAPVEQPDGLHRGIKDRSGLHTSDRIGLIVGSNRRICAIGLLRQASRNSRSIAENFSMSRRI